MMNRGQPVLDELLRHERDAIEPPLLLHLRGVSHALSSLIDGGHRKIGHASVELALSISVVGSTVRVRRLLGDAGHLKRLAVVETGVPAAMMHADGVLG